MFILLGIMLGAGLALVVLGKVKSRRNYEPIGGGYNGRVSPKIQKYHGKSW